MNVEVLLGVLWKLDTSRVIEQSQEHENGCHFFSCTLPVRYKERVGNLAVNHRLAPLASFSLVLHPCTATPWKHFKLRLTSRWNTLLVSQSRLERVTCTAHPAFLFVPFSVSCMSAYSMMSGSNPRNRPSGSTPKPDQPTPKPGHGSLSLTTHC